ncbi:MAG: hypothetical protein ACXW14_11525, partial [Burkholderiaceae bacterium]
MFREFMESSVEAMDSRYVASSLILHSEYKVVNSETQSALAHGSAELPACYTKPTVRQECFVFAYRIKSAAKTSFLMASAAAGLTGAGAALAQTWNVNG